MNDDFVSRLRVTFDNASMAEIGRRLGMSHATVRNYFQGRYPAADVLIKIANETGVSLNWLLTGAGDRYGAQLPQVGIGRFLEEKIEEMVDKKLAALTIDGVTQLGSVDDQDDFDVESAVLRLNNPEQIMSEWFRHEGREYPQDYGVVFFRGWESFTTSEKSDALRDAKRVLDRSLAKL